MPEINDQYIIQKETLADIADGVRWRTGRCDGMSPAEMIAGLKKDYGVSREHQIDIIPEETWVRPAGWPDLDSLNLEMAGDDFIYMTYDANRDASAIAWHINTANRQPATIDIGHISDGVYIVDESHSVNHNTNYIRWTDDLSGYLVLRITGQIEQCYMITATRNGQTQTYRQQPILERIAWVPHLTHFCTAYSSNAWSPFSLEREKIANGEGLALKSLYYAWGYCRRLKDLDISGIHTPNVTDFTYTFGWCQCLKTLDLRHWDVRKAVTFNSIFSTCYGLQRIDLTGWVTGHCTNFSSMFTTCRSLAEIVGLEDFDTSNAATLAAMFNGCFSLDHFPVEGWDTGNCTNLSSMFNECYMLKEVDLSGWDVRKVTTIGSMFNGCQALRRINFDGWETGVITGSASSLFAGCNSLESLDVSWLHLTDKCTSIYNMFSNCWLLKELEIPDDWDLSGISSASNTANAFCYNCYSLERISGIKDWQFSFTNALSSMFSNCRCLREIDVSGWKTDTVTSLASMFAYCYSLERVDLSGWRTDNCTNLSAMFQGCWSLKDIGDISGWNTSNVTSFASMFADCYSLPEFPNVSGWDFSMATTCASMFSGMTSVKEITMTDLNLANCTTVATMFRYCRALERATLTGWSIPKVTATSPSAFLGDCYNLRDLVIDIPFTLAHSYYNDEGLSHESLMNIINELPAVSSRRNLALTNMNINRLTAEERQAATDKGWNLVNS